MSNFVLIPESSGFAEGFNWDNVAGIYYHPGKTTGQDEFDSEGVPIGTVMQPSLTLNFDCMEMDSYGNAYPKIRVFTGGVAERLYAAYCRMAAAW